MFAHVLLPTDGSELSDMAIFHGVHFAKEAGAKVTGICVLPRFHLLAFGMAMIEETQEKFMLDGRAQAERHLARLQQVAAEEGVPCNTVVEIGDHPYEAIIRVALSMGCDLIMMASHGRRGMQGLLLGSETQKVLTHSRIPVLVYR